MARRKKHRKSVHKRADSPPPSPDKPFWRQRWLLVVVAVVATGITAWAVMRPVQKATATAPPKSPYPSLTELAAMTPEQLAKVDIALMNLLCAEGLRGSEGLDIPKALKALDQYAMHVEKETTRHLYRFRKNPEEYQNSEPYFRLMMMAIVMQDDFGARYNPSLMVTPDRFDLNDGFSDDARNVFLNGLTGPPMMGTCSSMPVLYVAVGRRLGYPLFLASTKGHLFARWDDGRTRINMEGTSQGFGSYGDDHYKSFPMKATDEEIAANRYLESMSPSDELACFLFARSECVLTMSKYAHANWCIREAARLAPNVRGYQLGVKIVEQELADFTNRQIEQVSWGLDHPGEPLPAALRHPMRKRKMNP